MNNILQRSAVPSTGFRRYWASRAHASVIARFSLKKKTATRCISGQDVSFDLGDYDQRFFFFDVLNEPENVALVSLIGKVSSNPVYIDVGANFGQFAAAVTDSFSQSHLVEPNPSAVLTLRTIFRQRPDVRIHNAAASDVAGNANLLVPTGHSGGATVTQRSRNPTNAPTVCVQRLDDLVKVKDDDSVFLKIDVEGHEAQVLSGATQLLKHQPIVGFETHCTTQFFSCASLLPTYEFFVFRTTFKPGRRGISKLLSATTALIRGPALSLQQVDVVQGFASMVFAVPSKKLSIFHSACKRLIATGVAFR